jgi:hypothetical protein
MPEPDPHFIGWLPMPRAFARFLAPVAIGLLVGAGVLAGVVAFHQPLPGTGQWDDQPTTHEGVVYAEPYAMLRVPGADGPETLLLVEEGKHGAKDRVKPFDGQPVRVSGTLLHRDGRRLLELSSGESGLRPVEMSAERRSALERTTPASLGTVTLVGEIIDPKCYLGGMKPGAGRTHKGCAVLCLRGGIPPMFVSHSADGSPAYYLLTNSDRGPLSPDVFGRVGERVTMTAELERWGDLHVLKVRPEDVSP